MSESTKSLIVEHNGQAHTLIEWSRITGINYKTLRERYLYGHRGARLFAKTKTDNCKICGKEFVSKCFATKCCSDECKKENARINGKKWTDMQKALKPKKKEKKLTVTEIAAMAKKAGVSYGQYVAQMEGRW